MWVCCSLRGQVYLAQSKSPRYHAPERRERSARDLKQQLSSGTSPDAAAPPQQWRRPRGTWKQRLTLAAATCPSSAPPCGLPGLGLRLVLADKRAGTSPALASPVCAQLAAPSSPAVVARRCEQQLRRTQCLPVSPRRRPSGRHRRTGEASSSTPQQQHRVAAASRPGQGRTAGAARRGCS